MTRRLIDGCDAISAQFPEERLVIPAGGLKVRSNTRLDQPLYEVAEP